MKRLFLFLGKGGVGKTTSSAALSYYLADKGYSVFWFSVDPAHNISDVVGCDVSKAKQVYKRLFAYEVDVGRYLQLYIEDAISRMKRLYKHLSVVGLDKIVESMRYSPGMEEVAVLYSMHHVLKDAQDYDYVVVDTPPTGLTLRILALPKLNIEWIGVLRQWRLRILERRRMVASIKGEEALGEGVAVAPEEDKVLQELAAHYKLMKGMWDLFSGDESVKILVVNQDKLSIQEGLRIKETLKDLGMNLRAVLINKFGLFQKEISEIREHFRGVPIYEVPFIKEKESLAIEDYLTIGRFWVEEVLK